ncbi:MAG: TolC family outer membrane protein [Bauldia litoralis]
MPICAVVVAASWSVANTTWAAELHDVVRRAVRTHPEVGALRANNRAVRQDLRAARGAYLPQIDARAAVGHQWINDPTTRTRAGRRNGENGWVDMNRYEAGVNLRQLIFDGFQTDRTVEREMRRVKAAMYRVQDTAQAIALRAIEAYLEVQRTRHIVQVSQRNVRIHRQILSRVYARAKGGRGPRSDVDQARARLYQAEAALASARLQNRNATALYIQAVGQPPEGPLSPVSAPESELPGNVDAAVEVAMRQAPAIRASAADVRAAVSEIGVATSRFYPRVDAELSYSIQRGVDGTRGDSNNFIALLVGRWSLYTGGTDTALRRKAIAQREEARDKLDQSRREVAQQVRNAWNALNAARERRVAVRKELAANRRVRIAYARQFDRGQRTLLDLVDIQNEIFNNETTLMTEKYTIIFGVYRTLATMGRLLDIMQIELPYEAKRKPHKGLFRSMKDEIPKIGFSRKTRK